MKIVAVIILLLLIYILISKLTKRENFTNLLNFDSVNSNKKTELIKKTIFLEEYDTDSFHPKFVIADSNKKPYLFVNDFWEMYNLNINVQDKDRKIISTIKHYNYNIYNYNLDNKNNKFQNLNKNNKLFIITSKSNHSKTFDINGTNNNSEIIYINEKIGNITKNEKEWKIEINEQYQEYKNIIALGYMIYVQLLKEHQHISI
jgi:VCBS repeat-containing protein